MEIKLPSGDITIVDDEVYEDVSNYKWCKSGGGYVSTWVKGKTVYMHRLIMDVPNDFVVDHINGNTLDNRKENLRVCTKKENLRNRKLSKNNKVGYKGVWLNGGRYQAAIVKKHLGAFDTAEDAALAYDEAARKLFGDFARLNFPPK